MTDAWGDVPPVTADQIGAGVAADERGIRIVGGVGLYSPDKAPAVLRQLSGQARQNLDRANDSNPAAQAEELLAIVRDLAAVDPIASGWECPLCSTWQCDGGEHADDCPWVRAQALLREGDA